MRLCFDSNSVEIEINQFAWSILSVCPYLVIGLAKNQHLAGESAQLSGEAFSVDKRLYRASMPFADSDFEQLCSLPIIAY